MSYCKYYDGVMRGDRQLVVNDVVGVLCHPIRNYDVVLLRRDCRAGVFSRASQ